MIHRSIVLCSVILLGLLISERRLSDSASRGWEEPRLSELWERVRHTESPPERYSQRQAAGVGLSRSPTTPWRNCPMVISLNKNSKYEFTSVDDGVRFDIDGDGRLELVSWTAGNSDVAFLGFDRAGDGRIADGRELVGNHTVAGITSNGPNALMALAREGRRLVKEERGSFPNSVINVDNPLFSKFVLWFDVNHNGISDDGELRPAETELANIGLGFSRHHVRDRHGNESRYRGFVNIRTALGPNNAWAPEESMKRGRPMYSVCLGGQ